MKIENRKISSRTRWFLCELCHPICFERDLAPSPPKKKPKQTKKKKITQKIKREREKTIWKCLLKFPFFACFVPKWYQISSVRAAPLHGSSSREMQALTWLQTDVPGQQRCLEQNAQCMCCICVKHTRTHKKKCYLATACTGLRYQSVLLKIYPGQKSKAVWPPRKTRALTPKARNFATAGGGGRMGAKVSKGLANQPEPWSAIKVTGEKSESDAKLHILTL